MTRFNAWNFARSWASVALASGNDSGRPSLYRTVLIEQFAEGVRLVATDSYLLLKAWVPDVDADDAPEPTIDEVPGMVAICADVDQRVLSLMKYTQKLTAGDGGDTPVTIDFAIGSDTGENQLEGFERSSVVFRLSERYDEQIKSPMFEGTFPNWRPLWVNHRWKPTGIIGFGIDGILRLGKLSALWSKAVINFELGGTVGVAKVKIVAPDVNVSGLVMPVAQKDPTPPPSVEGLEAQVGMVPDPESDEFAHALDDFISECLKAEDPAGGADAVADALLEQLKLAAAAAQEAGAISVDEVVDLLDSTPEGAEYVIEQLRARGVVDENNTFIAMPDDLIIPPADGTEEPL